MADGLYNDNTMIFEQVSDKYNVEKRGLYGNFREQEKYFGDHREIWV